MLHRTRHWQREGGKGGLKPEGNAEKGGEGEVELAPFRGKEERKEGRTQKVEKRARSDLNGNEIQPVSIEKERHRVPKWNRIQNDRMSWRRRSLVRSRPQN